MSASHYDIGTTSSLAIVGGCGHVGLPLGMAFACKGFQVDLLDLSVERVETVNLGRMPFQEEGADEVLPELIRLGTLRATTDWTVLRDAPIAIVTIGTPVDEYLDPTVAQFDAAIQDVVLHSPSEQLLILRSTVFPGVTERLQRQLTLWGREDIDLAYCPERIAQGHALKELECLPQIVGGTTEKAAQRAAALFEIVCPKVVHLRPIEAELAKLFCNAYRYINFAIANQFFEIANKLGGDFQKIHAAVRDDYPRMQSFPRAGFAAGPCLVKDTMQLGAFNHGSFVLGQAAMMINEGLPFQIVQELKRRYPLDDMTVGILGMAFKANVDDARDSLSYKLRKILTMECHAVLCTDPYVSDERLAPLAEVLDQADILIVGTPHDCYRGLKTRQPLIDVTGFIGTMEPTPHVAAPAPAGLP